MHKSFTCAFALAVVVSLTVIATAQPQSAAPLVPTRLALEIVFLKGQPPSLYPVASEQAKQSGGYATRFGRINNWQPPEGMATTRAVQVISRLEGKAVKVQISVLTGRESIEREVPVITFVIEETKPITINELTQFGVEPIEIKLVRVAPRTAILPQVINNTESVIMIGIAVGNSTLPSYQLSLQNVSVSDVMALEVNIMLGGKKEIIMMPWGEEGRALIPAGSPYKLTISGAYQVRPSFGDNPPDFTREHDCILSSVVFRDGTYEGDPNSASRLQAIIRGYQLQLARVVTILQEAINSSDDVSATMQHVKLAMSSLKTEIEGSEVKGLLDKFSSLPANAKSAIIPAVQTGMSKIKKSALDEVDKFGQSQQGVTTDRATLQMWLQATKDKYQQWLSKL